MPERPLRVLVVDDSRNDVLLLEKAFQIDGRLEIVKQAGDAAEGLAWLDAVAADPAGRPDLVLLDINMPGRDGFEVLRVLKADRRLASIPVVMMTTSRRQEDIARCYVEGAASHVTKPLTFEALCELTHGLASYWSEVASIPAG
jgi:CheY-like chemotaxis protein